MTPPQHRQSRQQRLEADRIDAQARRDWQKREREREYALGLKERPKRGRPLKDLEGAIRAAEHARELQAARTEASAAAREEADAARVKAGEAVAERTRAEAARRDAEDAMLALEARLEARRELQALSAVSAETSVAEASRAWNAAYATGDYRLEEEIDDAFLPVCLYNVAALDSALEAIACRPGPSTARALPPPLEVWLREVGLYAVRQAIVVGGARSALTSEGVRAVVAALAPEDTRTYRTVPLAPTTKGATTRAADDEAIYLAEPGTDSPRTFEACRKSLASAAASVLAVAASSLGAAPPAVAFPVSYRAADAHQVSSPLDGVSASSTLRHYLMTEVPPLLLSQTAHRAAFPAYSAAPVTSGGIPGVTTPYVYIADGPFPFAMHTEDLDLPSVNTQLAGEAKLWYVLPGRERAAATAAMQDLYQPGNRKRKTAKLCPQALRHLAAFAHPSMLRELGLHPRLVRQLPGMTVITAGDAVHAGMNVGANLNVAINVCDPDAPHAGCNCQGGVPRKSLFPPYSA
ncbi:hypothetical protein JCM3770_005531 [Rhodotorula araucariae]